jgi:hypothetical protein
MAKRFTDKSKHRDPWYRKLPPAYKALWEYINDESDNAGVWVIDFETAAYFVGSEVNALDAKKVFEDRIITAGAKWFIRDYVVDQYGYLHGTSNIHKSVIARLKSHGVDIDDNGLPIFKSSENLKIDGIAIPSGWVKNKDKEQEEEKDNTNTPEPDEKIIPLTPAEDPLSFKKIWDLYDKKIERDASEKLWNKLSKEDRQKIFEHVPAYVKSTPEKQFRKYFTTYINKKSWNDEIQTNEQPQNRVANGGFRSTAQITDRTAPGKL